jgi:hypothetical protein
MNATEVRISTNPPVVILKPIVCLQTAAAILGPDFSAEHVLRDIKRGPMDPQRIEWAWDMAGARAHSRDGGKLIRVFAACVPTVERAKRHSLEEVLQAAFGDLLPLDEHAGGKRRHCLLTIPASTLARRLACATDHVLALAKTGSLAELPRTRRIGRSGSPAITWESIVQFLTERRFQ